MRAGDQEQVQRHQHADHDGQQQHVADVKARHECVGSRELAAPYPDGEVRPDERDRHQYRVGDREAHARQQIVHQRVAGEALHQRQRQHRDADVVVDVARGAERAGEEDPHQVDRDRRHEDERRPVVCLADEQPRAGVEREVDHRAVGVGHVRAAQRRVGAVVGRLSEARLEEGEIDAGHHQDDERVKGDLAEQERPVVGEHVPKSALERGRRPGACRRPPASQRSARARRRPGRRRNPRHGAPCVPSRPGPGSTPAAAAVPSAPRAVR